MSDLPVLYESDGRLARITLNRPEVLNAIDDALPAALESAVKRANSDQRIRAIILAGLMNVDLQPIFHFLGEELHVGLEGGLTYAVGWQ